MRVRDLKPNKQYATCEGQLVVPVEPIHANWYWQLNPTKRCDGTEDDPDNQAWELVDGGDEPKVKQDPWGPCHKPANRGLKQTDAGVRRTKPGVLVNFYDHDRDGNPTYHLGRKVVPPSDIAGSWKEYLTLYADVVRERIDERQREQERNDAIEEIKLTLARLHGVAPAQVDLVPGRRDREEGFITARIRLHLPLPYPLDDDGDSYVAVAAGLSRETEGSPEPEGASLGNILGYKDRKEKE